MEPRRHSVCRRSRLRSTPALFPQATRLVTSDFPSQRYVNAFPNQLDSTNGTVTELRGGTIPAARQEHRQWSTGYQEFSLFHFQAVGAAYAMPFSIALAGSMSFADGAELTGPTSWPQVVEVSAR